MEEGSVNLNIKNGIGIIEFYHPKSNSLPANVLENLAQTIISSGKNKDIRVIILKSKGDRVFCAGASFQELSDISNTKQGKEFFMGFANVINAARECPKLIIGRVQGKAVGGGVGMACATDYCYATKYASVKLSELSIGIGPFVVGPAVERKAGLSAYSTLTINATKWFSAEWAKQKGIYSEVFETVEQMDHEISELASKLEKSNPQAMQKLKEVFWSDYKNWDQLLKKRAEFSGELILSNFTKEAISRFNTK